MKHTGQNPWALVLSGGGAKGLAHIGVLKALEAMGAPRPGLIVGTSMGAIVGGCYACGMSAAELERFVLDDFDIRHYLDGFAFQLPGGPVSRILQTGQALGNLATKPGMDSGKKILDQLEKMCGGARFEGTRIPFRCNAVDLITGEETVFSAGSVALAIRASMAFPGFFEPVDRDGKLLVDGGLADNMPVRIAREAGFKRVLAVDVWTFRRTEPSALKNGPAVIYRAFEIAAARSDRQSADDRATFAIKADDGASPFDFARAKRLIRLGERAAEEHHAELETFFRNGPLWAIKRSLRRAARMKGN